DKASLRLGSRTLLEISTAKLRAITPSVFTVGSQEKFGPQAIADIFPDRGPLGGIHAALAAAQAELNLVLAVDLPLVEGKFMEYLLLQARLSEAAAILPRTSDGYQPLCALYRPAFLPAAEAALNAGQNKVDAVFSQVQ